MRVCKIVKSWWSGVNRFFAAGESDDDGDKVVDERVGGEKTRDRTHCEIRGTERRWVHSDNNRCNLLTFLFWRLPRELPENPSGGQ